jgi:putative PIN family toxin of toxin-antitoxin system
MARLVLDTNSLIQCLPSRSRYHIVWNSFIEGTNILCVTNEILEEYIEILQKLVSVDITENIIKTILNSPFTEFITPYYHFELIQVDMDDNKFVDCAIASNAKCIITNDHHYDILMQIPFPKVVVKTIQEFTSELLLNRTVD